MSSTPSTVPLQTVKFSLAKLSLIPANKKSKTNNQAFQTKTAQIHTTTLILVVKIPLL